MIHVEFDPNQLVGDERVFWDRWSRRAKDATDALIGNWRNSQALEFDSAIWTELKVWLMDHVFHGKCAYCEINIRGARHPADAEHFRPKGEVRYIPQGKKRSKKAQAHNEHGDPADHPGYFWLAYHWRNLLPTCIECNRAVKRCLFPVENEHLYVVTLAADQVADLKEDSIEYQPESGRYLLGPQDLNDREGCQLLHPYAQNPTEHLRFGEGGVVVDLTDQGKHSIEIYKLDGADLDRERQREQERARRKFRVAREHAEENLDKSREESGRYAWQFLAKWKSGKEKFSAAALDYIRYVEHVPDPENAPHEA